MSLIENPQKIEQLKGRYELLNTKKITAEANLKNSSEALERLRKQAREQYGTDDLDSLRTQLEEMKRENERKRKEYQDHLSTIESQLEQVESEHPKSANPEAQA